MKNWKSLVIVVITMLTSIIASAQNHVTLSLSNCSSPAFNTFEFDLYVVNDGTSSLKLNSVSYGVNFNTSLLSFPATDTMTCVFSPGTSDLPSTITNTFSFLYSKTLHQLKITTSSGAVTSSSAPSLALNTPVKVGHLVVTVSHNFVSGSTTGGGNIALSTSSASGSTNTGAVVYVGTATSTTGLNSVTTRSVNVSCSIILGCTVVTWYKDFDTDGFGNPDSTKLACTQPSGYVANNTDCNDNDITVHTPQSYFVDGDHDTYGTSATQSFCQSTAPSGFSSVSGDCNDSDPSIHPGQTDICNGTDDDCDTQIDEDATFTTYYLDTDHDTYGSSSDPGTSLCSNPGVGYSTNHTDCNDADPAIHPNQSDLCNGTDDDCDTQIDEDATFTTYYLDTDHDTYGSSTDPGASYCSNPGAGYSTDHTDCDDSDPAVNPAAQEVCNGHDDDCDGDVDDDDPSISVASQGTYYHDGDLDGYGTGPVIHACVQPDSSSTVNGDCDDTNPTRHPGAPEQCNGIDDDCDTQVDEDLTLITWYADLDGDGYGNPAVFVLNCAQPPGFVLSNTDCNDNPLAGGAAIHPNQTDVCNGIDDDCDTQIDEDATFVTYYVDSDHDTYGSSSDPGTSLCTNPGSGYSTNNGDCADNNPAIHPGQTDGCNGIDDDCDTQIDEDVTFVTYYIDSDHDTYGSSSDPGTSLCTNPGSGYSTNNGDCADNNPAIHPGQTDGCNGIDDDCDTQIDEDATFVTYYVDSDHDTYGSSSDPGTSLCTNPGSGYSTNHTDCDDGNPAIHPGQTDGCNGIDDDCDLSTDEDATFVTYYVDSDHDTYGSSSDPGTSLCTNPGSGYSTNHTDCDDGNANVNPDATEVCNGIDDDCDTQIDENGITAIASTSDATSFCPGGSAVLHASPSGSGQSFQWHNNGGPIAGATNSSYTATAADDYYVVITQAQCSGTSNTITITIYTSPTASASPPGPIPACSHYDVILSANTGTGLTYVWYRNNHFIVGATNATYNTGGVQAGNFKVVVSDSHGCSATSNTVNIIRLSTPPATIAVQNPPNNPDLCVNGQVKLVANASASPSVVLLYQWKLNDADISGATNRTYFANTVGAYKVRVTQQDDGCTRTSSEVNVIQSCRYAGLETVANLNMYPNPTAGHFVIDLNLNSNVDGEGIVQVFNSIGQSVLGVTVPVEEGRMTKEISLGDNDAAGAYFVKIIVNDQVYMGQMLYQK